MRKNFAKSPSATSLQAGAESLLILGFVALVYSRLIAFSFVSFDDLIHVRNNPLLYGSKDFLHDLWEIWRGPYKGLYIPVTYTFWYLTAALGAGLSADFIQPGLFHLLNIIFHAANGLVLLRLLRNLGASKPISLVGVGFFLIHPLQVEPVTWVSGFKDLCMAFFALLSLLLVSRLKERNGLVAYATILLCGVFAVLSKPAAVTLPLMWILLDTVLRSGVRKSVLLLALMGIACSLPAVGIAQSLQLPEFVKGVPSFSGRLVNAFSNLGFYLSKTLLPLNLAFRYGEGHWATQFVVGLLGLGLIPLSIVGRGFSFSFGLWLFLLSLAPMLGLVPYFYQNFSPVADRYAYFALVGAAVFLSQSLSKLKKSWVKRGLVPIFLLLILVNGAQQSYWRSDFKLVERAARVAPSAQTLYNHATLRRESWIRENAGQVLPPELLHSLEAEYREAIRLDSKLPEPYLGLATLLLEYKNLSESERLLLTAKRLSPENADIHNTLAQVYAATGRLALAEALLEKAIEWEPRNPGHHANLGLLLDRRGELRRALGQYHAALSLWENAPPWLEGRINSVTEKLAGSKKESSTP